MSHRYSDITDGLRTARSGESMIRANDVDLCIETFGDAGDPAVLLIAGAAGSMDWWEDAFCERLAAGRRFVIRYDHRDTGRSVSYPPGKPGYTFRDLAADAIGILDALGIARAHIAGLSMGGGIAQLLALEHPERIATLTLLSTSPVRAEHLDLPPMSDALQATFGETGPATDWSDRAAAINAIADVERPYAGSIGFDRERMRGIAARVVDRTVDIESSLTNHFVMGDDEPIQSELGQVTAPTLVLHGTDDPFFPYGHAEALAMEIPGAHLIPLEESGHQYPPPEVWDVAIPALLEHTRRA